MKRYFKKGLLVLWFAWFFIAFTSMAWADPVTVADYFAVPPFVGQSIKPNVIIALDVSGSMKAPAYWDAGAGNWRTVMSDVADGTAHDDYNPDHSDPNTNPYYYGYFNGTKKYKYVSGNPGYFAEATTAEEASLAGQLWDGDFLNWLTTRRVDAGRKVLVGGKVDAVYDDGRGGSAPFYLIGQKEPSDGYFTKTVSDAEWANQLTDSRYFPTEFNAGVVAGTKSTYNGFRVEGAQIKPQMVGGAGQTLERWPLSDGSNTAPVGGVMEVGELYNSASEVPPGIPPFFVNLNWYTHTMTSDFGTPIVVAKPASSVHGGQYGWGAVRLRNVSGGADSFDIKFQEWDYLDNTTHAEETVDYIAVEEGEWTVDLGGGDPWEVKAGSVNTNKCGKTNNTGDMKQITFATPFAYASADPPIVFAQVASNNDTAAVTVRIHSVDKNGFYVIMVEEEGADQSHSPEDINWIALEPRSGTINNLLFNVGSYSGQSDAEKTVNTGVSGTFFWVADMQTTNGADPCTLRWRNKADGNIKVTIKEEKSSDTETTHSSTETVGYVALSPGFNYDIRVEVPEEPTGLVQKMSSQVRWGLCVYNYDHDKADIFNGNAINGGTFWGKYPIYPKTWDDAADRVEVPLHVKADPADIVKTVEYHPQIWGTTPTAEMFYTIMTYFQQSTPYYYSTDWNVNADHAAKEYDISNDWDPYYFDELSTKVPCAQSFIIHITDGEPFRDGALPPAFQVSRDDPSEGARDTTQTAGGVGQYRNLLDDLTYYMHTEDLRPDATNPDLPGKQTLVTYNIMAALGAPVSSFKPAVDILKDASVNGAFEDDNDDGKPNYTDQTGATLDFHPVDWDTWDTNQAWTQTGYASEWDKLDEDGNPNPDGIPDTFFLATDGYRLEARLLAALYDIIRRVGSGTAASIISSSRSGEGALLQALFWPSRTDQNGNTLLWSGFLREFWVDEYGNLRENTDDIASWPSGGVQKPRTTDVITDPGSAMRYFLEPKTDRVVRYFYDRNEGRTRAYRFEVDDFGKIVTGQHDGSASNKVLIDSGADFEAEGVKANVTIGGSPGYWIAQFRQIDTDSDGKLDFIEPIAAAQITGVSNTTITTTANIDWEPGDSYTISQIEPEIVELGDLLPIWDAGNMLAQDSPTQRVYDTSGSGRYIFTWLDSNGDGVVDVGEVLDFTGTNKTSLRESLRAADDTEAEKIINYIRGQDQTGYRKRTYLVEGTEQTWKLGDIIYSTPTLVGAPAEDFDFIYNDPTYATYYRTHVNRRFMLYVGANDGMIHAFNVGWYDRDNRIYYEYHDTSNPKKMGQEMWAYVPYELLPHLKWLTDTDYPHVYYVDNKPKVVDVRLPGIWGNIAGDPVHPYGWGTILICGLRYGGKGINGGERFFSSTYFALDITDPESPPTLLWSFKDTVEGTAGSGTATTMTDAGADFVNQGIAAGMTIWNLTDGSRGKITAVTATTITAAIDGGTNNAWNAGNKYAINRMGLTTSYPAVARVLDKWYMVVGSGPNDYDGTSDRRGNIYVVDLEDGSLDYRFILPYTNIAVDRHPDEARSFIGDPVTVDIDLDTVNNNEQYSAELAYVGTVFENPGYDPSDWENGPKWMGKMYRIKMYDGGGAPQAPTAWSDNYLSVLAQPYAGGDTDYSGPVDYVVGPASAGANVAIDESGNYWVYFGTGRFLSNEDKTADLHASHYQLRNALYALKEPVAGGVLTLAEVSLNEANPDIFVATNAVVNEAGYVDTGTGWGQIHFNSLLSQMSTVNGWKIQLAENEKSLTMGAVIGGLELAPTYTPEDDICSFAGTSDLWAVYFKTGTAYVESVIGLEADVTIAGQTAKQVLRKTTLGVGVASAPAMHVGRSTKVFVQSSTGAIVDLEIETPFKTKSGLTSWRDVIP